MTLEGERKGEELGSMGNNFKKAIAKKRLQTKKQKKKENLK